MSVADGDLVGVVGGSGSGKTSLLRAIAGLDRLDHGRVALAGRDVTRADPGDRDVGMVFQSPALIGHLSARRNVSFPLDVRRVAADEIRRRVDAEVRALQIEDLMGREPATLSAGEQQMVQIARALVRVPAVLLLDEPFASLDDQLRRRMRAELAMLQSGYGVTTLMATNDSEDVEALAKTVVVLDGGRLSQLGATAEVRRSPRTLLAAVATGPMSLLEMTVVAETNGFWLVREDPAGGEPNEDPFVVAGPRPVRRSHGVHGRAPGRHRDQPDRHHCSGRRTDSTVRVGWRLLHGRRCPGGRGGVE